MVRRPTIFLITALLLPGLARAELPDLVRELPGVEAVQDAIEEGRDALRDLEGEFPQDELLALDVSGTGLAAVQQLGFAQLGESRLSALGFSVTRLKLPRGLTGALALQQLLALDPLGLYAPNAVYRLAGSGSKPETSNACSGQRCYGQSLIGWPTSGCALPLRIGMLDSAIESNHPGLRRRRIFSQRFSNSAPITTELDHGTAIASQLVGDAAAGYAGLLPAATLYAADVFAADARGLPYTDALRLVQGLDWLAQQQPLVINISLAGPESPVLRRAVQALQQRGIALAAAGGNQGSSAAAQYPAAYPEVLAVSAVDRRLQAYAQGNRALESGLAAPGVGIWTAAAGGTARLRDGSSFAVPYASAALALLRQGGESPAAAAMRLRKAARDLGAPGADARYGAGLLQAPACSAAAPGS